MKKSSVLVLFVILKLALFGQITAVSPYAGVSFSSVRGVENANFKFGYALGVSMDISKYKKVIMRPSIGLLQKGTILKNYSKDAFGSSLPSGYDAYFTYNYLNVSFLYEWHPYGTPNFYLSLGPYAGCLIGVTQRSVGFLENTAFDIRQSIPVKEYFFLDMGAQVGGGLKFPFNKSSEIRIDFLYDYGLKIVASPNPPPTETYKCLIGYAIKIGKPKNTAN